MAGEKIIEKISAENAENFVAPENKPELLENKIESRPSLGKKSRERLAPSEKILLPANIVATSQSQDFQKRRAQEIDNILAEGLHEIFLSLAPEKQQEFKRKGEETVAKINTLLSQTKVKINQIINLIRQWLRVVPGINKFFLEQETKIKADKILKIKDKF